MPLRDEHVSCLPLSSVTWRGSRGSQRARAPLALRIHLKWPALHDAEHQRRKPVAALAAPRARSSERAACPDTRRRGQAHRSAAFPPRRARTDRSSSSQPVAQIRGTVDLRVVEQPAPRIDGLPSSWLRHDRDAVEVLERRSRSDPSAGGTGRSPARTRCSTIFCASSAPWRCRRVRRRGGSGGTSGGGSGGLMPRMFVMIHLPRVTGEVRSGFASWSGTRLCRAARAGCPCRGRA